MSAFDPKRTSDVAIAQRSNSRLLLKAFQKADCVGQHQITAGECGHMIAPW